MSLSPVAAPAPSATASVRILLVDGHEIVREGLRVLLARTRGLAIVGEAGKTEDALEAFRRLRPDLVILDPCLPGQDGKDLIARFLRVDPWARVLILCAFEADADLHLPLAKGAKGLLLKREPLRELVKAIRSVAKGENFYSSRVASRIFERPNGKGLSAKELEVMELVGQGCTTEAIAERLGITPHTLKTHFTHIFEKLGTKDRAQALVEAVRRGMIRLS